MLPPARPRPLGGVKSALNVGLAFYSGQANSVPLLRGLRPAQQHRYSDRNPQAMGSGNSGPGAG